jgi:hypothetical protein
MIERAITDWNAEQDLEVLLDALTADLLAMPEHELAAWLREAGQPVVAPAERMRRLVAAADARCVAPHVAGALEAGSRTLVARTQ